MQLEPGDRVRFNASGLPDLTYHAPGDNQEHSWQDHFGDTPGCITAVDSINREVCVRGQDRHGHTYTVWIGVNHVTLTEMGVPR